MHAKHAPARPGGARSAADEDDFGGVAFGAR